MRRGGGGGGRGGGGNKQHRPNTGGGPSLPKKENILDLSKYVDKKISVKFAGGRVVTGSLKGYDPLLNLVLDDTEEELVNHETGREYGKRALGLVVCRGPTVILISPLDGTEEIANPFV
ncbi:hypothetical protein DFJ73DRAFT_643103 [Zopfochytrium polystomum]|nr:hypothetical protein DFJ73DRAFT_643103 [Zopfochytrium polystomum]